MNSDRDEHPFLMMVLDVFFILVPLSCHKKDKPKGSYGNGDISDIKDTGANGSDAYIYKIDDASFVENSVYQIARAPSQKERKGGGR